MINKFFKKLLPPKVGVQPARRENQDPIAGNSNSTENLESKELKFLRSLQRKQAQRQRLAIKPQRKAPDRSPVEPPNRPAPEAPKIETTDNQSNSLDHNNVRKKALTPPPSDKPRPSMPISGINKEAKHSAEKPIERNQIKRQRAIMRKVDQNNSPDSDSKSVNRKAVLKDGILINGKHQADLINRDKNNAKIGRQR